MLSSISASTLLSPFSSSRLITPRNQTISIRQRFKNINPNKTFMETTYEKTYTKQLQRLLGLVSDSRKNYLHAIDHTESNDLKELFKANILRRDTIIQELRTRISTNGGNPDDLDDSFLSKLERGWEGFKASVSGKGDQEVLEKCRNTDQAVLDGYDDVLQGNILENAELKTFLVSQRLSINESFLELDSKYFSLFKSDPSI